MTFRRKIMGFLIGVTAASFAGLSGCSSQPDPWEKQPGPPRVVVSIPPLYSFVKQVGGDKVGVLCLCTQTGPHHYQANAHDSLALRQADLLLGIGLGLDEKFLDKIRSNSGNSKLKYVKLGEGEGLKKHVKKLEGGDDPHVWLGIETAQELVTGIEVELKAVDPANAAYYAQNAKDYRQKLGDLQKDYLEKLRGKKDRKILPMHDALGYFKDSFNLDIQEAIELMPGEKPGSERYRSLVDKCKEEKIHVIATEPQYEEKEAETLKTELKKKGVEVELIVIDPLETADPKDLDADWYERKMRQNLDTLVEKLK